MDPDAPTTAAVMGGGVYLLVPLGITLWLLALGLRVFRRENPRVPEHG